MGITKKFLQSIEIPDNKIEPILEEHANAIAGLTADRDKYKEQAAQLANVEKELVKAQAKVEDYESLQDSLKKLRVEYADFKADVENKNLRALKEKAYSKLLSEAGIPEKRHEKIIKVTDLSEIEIDEKGVIKDSKKYVDSIKDEWSDFVVTKTVKGADVPNPPTNVGGNSFEKMSLAEKMAFANDHPDSPEVKTWLNE